MENYIAKSIGKIIDSIGVPLIEKTQRPLFLFCIGMLLITQAIPVELYLGFYGAYSLYIFWFYVEATAILLSGALWARYGMGSFIVLWKQGERKFILRLYALSMVISVPLSLLRYFMAARTGSDIWYLLILFDFLFDMAVLYILVKKTHEY